jgi:hypothetical protein
MITKRRPWLKSYVESGKEVLPAIGDPLNISEKSD